MGILDAFAHIVKAEASIVKRAIFNNSDEVDGIDYDIMPVDVFQEFEEDIKSDYDFDDDSDDIKSSDL